jgi:glycosyltransferase involved in cell wall biosynthesis
VEKRLKVALVHDYLVQDGGAERVLAAMQEMFPQAPTFVLLYDKNRAHPQFKNRIIKTSPLSKFPFANKHSEWYVTLMPTATEYMDITGYDLVLSSSIAFAKGVILPPETKHICYCHTPTRFLWQDRIGYLNDLPQPRFFRALLPHLLHGMRTWDRIAAERPDVFLTNSQTSRARIRRYYGRDAAVIYPPVDIEHIQMRDCRGSYWLAGGRLVGYKRFDLVVKAFARLDLPLKIFGVGPEEKRLKKIAGPRTEFLGRVNDETKIQLYQNAIGFIHPQLEDFGIAAVEAMAAGKPVIAYGKGGAAETIIPGVTGVHIEAQTWVDIGDAVIRFKPNDYDPYRIRAHAETFSTKRFQEELRAFINRAIPMA